MHQEERATIRTNFAGVEDGSIYFFYRPKSSSVTRPQEVERIYIVLHPLAAKQFRLIALDAARLPSEGDPFNFVTGTVIKVDSKQYVIQECLRQQETSVHGVPVLRQAAARACGEGVYSFAEFSDGLHLVYVLELPGTELPVQKGLGIDPEVNFLAGVLNPYYSDPSEDEEKSSAFPRFPDHLKARLGSDRVIHTGVPEFLGFEHARVVLYRSDSAGAKELKPRLHPLGDTYETADIFTDLRLRREQFPVEPLFSGEWV